jgi:hypothetical protein
LTDAFSCTYYIQTLQVLSRIHLHKFRNLSRFSLDFLYLKMADPESESVKKANRESRREVTKERYRRKKEKREAGVRDKRKKKEKEEKREAGVKDKRRRRRIREKQW